MDSQPATDYYRSQTKLAKKQIEFLKNQDKILKEQIKISHNQTNLIEKQNKVLESQTNFSRILALATIILALSGIIQAIYNFEIFSNGIKNFYDGIALILIGLILIAMVILGLKLIKNLDSFGLRLFGNKNGKNKTLLVYKKYFYKKIQENF